MSIFDSKKSLQKNHLGTVTTVQNVHCTRHSDSACSVLRQPIDCSHPQQRVFFFILFFSRPRFHCFCTALFLLNHILFITVDWIQYHFCQKKRAFATTSTRDDTFQVCYSRYQPIRVIFRGTICRITNYTVFFRPVRRNNILIVFGLYLVCIWFVYSPSLVSMGLVVMYLVAMDYIHSTFYCFLSRNTVHSLLVCSIAIY